jgi:ParB family chromosome partitioning protein
MQERKALGRGLEALFPTHAVSSREKIEAVELDTIKIKQSRHQSREKFDPQVLAELAESIKQRGVIQPVLVRRQGDHFELIAGERRLRAAIMAGFDKIPAIIKEVDELSALQMSLIENLQRQDLNPLEEATGFKKLLDEFSLTQEKVAELVGKNRVTVANTLRLFELPVEIKRYIAEDKISAGHARALLAIPGDRDRLRVAEKIIMHGLSVRDTEALARRLSKRKDIRKKSLPTLDIHLKDIEDRLQKALGRKVRFIGKNYGRVYFEYYSPDDLETLLKVFTKAFGVTF